MSDWIEEIQEQEEDIAIFTKREFQCIAQIIQGNCLSKLSVNLNMTRRTAYFHINNIGKKFEILTKRLIKNSI